MHDRLNPAEVPVTVDAVILSVREGALRVMLSRRKEEPYSGRWALPGRFLGSAENAEEAVRLLLEEMLPVSGAFVEQLYTFSAQRRDPRGRVVSIAHLVILPASPRALREAEARPGMRGFAVSLDDAGLRLRDGDTELRGDELAFDHGQIVETALRRLRGKIGYTDIGFHFLADSGAFTLGELQSVFEAVLARREDSSNFRRMIRAQYEKTGRLQPLHRMEIQGPGRPSALYCLKTE